MIYLARFVAAALCVSLMSCQETSDGTCEAGRQQECPCLGGRNGVQVCDDGGTHWSPCDCAMGADDATLGPALDAASPDMLPMSPDAGVPSDVAEDAAVDVALEMDLTVSPADQGVSGQSYYVSATGNDEHDGSAERPWRTLQRAVNDVTAGDIISILPGRYAGFIVDGAPERDGTREARVIIQAIGDGPVIIDRPGPENYMRGGTQNHFDLTGTDYWTIDGLVFEGATRAGIAILGFPEEPVQGVRVTNCVLRNSGVWGIFSGFADDLHLERNDASGSMREHGIYVSNSSRRPVVVGNRLHGNSGAGLHLNGDVSAGGVGYIDDAYIARNEVFDNGTSGGSGINCDGCRGALIENNLLYRSRASGISIYFGDAAGPPSDNVIVNNTIFQAPDGRWAVNIQGQSERTVIFNNILWTPHRFRGVIALCAECVESTTSDNNLLRARLSLDGDATVVGVDAWRAAGFGVTSTFVDSRDALALDEAFTPRADSPAVDTGVEALAGQRAPESDYVGAQRPAGMALDVGAIERPQP